MTWIRFEASEPPLGLQRLEQMAQGEFDLANLRENASLVIFFLHNLDCPGCRETLCGFVQKADELKTLDAEVVVVVPAAEKQERMAFAPLRILVDRNGEARAELSQLLEFDTNDQLLLFVLNQYWVPSAAWVGKEANDPDLVERTLKRLDYIAIQCPE